MRITQLKKNISELVEVSSDKEFLEMVFNILDDRVKNEGRDVLDDLSQQDLRRIDKSIEQIKIGKVVAHETVMKKIRRKISDAKKRKVV